MRPLAAVLILAALLATGCRSDPPKSVDDVRAGAQDRWRRREKQLRAERRQAAESGGEQRGYTQPVMPADDAAGPPNDDADGGAVDERDAE